MTRHFLSISIILLTLLIIGLILFGFFRERKIPIPIYSATVNRDCAPWDGSAFTLSIPMEGSAIHISIYQSPEINHLATFSFPDEAGNIGNSFYLPQVGSTEPLTGQVTLRKVEQDNPVEGEFYLKTENGKEFRGKFLAEWGNEIVYCG